MPPVTIGFGVAMILLGAGFYLGTETQSVTALIPAFAGILFVLLGVLAFKEGLRKHVMHAAAALGLLGMIGSGVRGIPQAIKHFSGEQLDKPAAFGPGGKLVHAALPCRRAEPVSARPRNGASSERSAATPVATLPSGASGWRRRVSL